MAIFKKILNVIKEEMNQSSTKVNKNDDAMQIRPGENYQDYYLRVNQQSSSETQTEKVVAHTGMSEEKKNGNTPKTKGHRKSKKAKSAKSMSRRMERLPEDIEKSYAEARKAAKKGNYKEAIRLFEEVRVYVLGRICKKKNISLDGKTQEELMIEVGKKLGASSKQQKKMSELYQSIHRIGRFADMSDSELMAEISHSMSFFIDITYKKKKQANNNNNKREKSGKVTADKEIVIEDKLSFKAREYIIKAEPFVIDRECPEIAEHFTNAKKRYMEKDLKGALYEIRMTLENMILYMAKKIPITFERRENLEERIRKIENSGKISKPQAAVLHRIRVAGNKGSHENRIPLGDSDVEKAMSEMDEAIKIFTAFMSDGDEIVNKPLFDSNEYYSVRRKYYGRWANCFSYGELMMIDDFAELKKKADSGDIQAMLDIASGFLEEHICWTEESLIYLRKYQNNFDPCDARYYYWILMACQTAYKDWKEGKPLPLRYLANALLEGIKFIHGHESRYSRAKRASDYVLRNSDQFHTDGHIFGSFTGANSFDQREYAQMLFAMMKEYGDKNLFAPVHKERTYESILRYKCWHN